jgi:hypothetical protein
MRRWMKIFAGWPEQLVLVVGADQFGCEPADLFLLAGDQLLLEPVPSNNAEATSIEVIYSSSCCSRSGVIRRRNYVRSSR